MEDKINTPAGRADWWLAAILLSVLLLVGLLAVSGAGRDESACFARGGQPIATHGDPLCVKQGVLLQP